MPSGRHDGFDGPIIVRCLLLSWHHPRRFDGDVAKALSDRFARNAPQFAHNCRLCYNAAVSQAWQLEGNIGYGADQE
jgi:hypothetical protein